MKKLLNTLYITTQGSYLAKEGEAVIVKADEEVKLRVPIHSIGSIVCFGQVSCSPFLMGFCGENNVAISFLSEHGRFLARVEGPTSGNVLLRREQYRRAEDLSASSELARFFVIGKILNCRKVLQRALRDHGETDDADQLRYCENRLAQYARRLQKALPLEEVRGAEGDVSRSYFNVFDDFITAQKEDFFFHGRTRRPPEDNVNCLLSFIYSIMAHDARSAIECVGLDPQVGFLHRERPGRPSLALDLMEELRPAFGDRLALTLINLRQVQGKGFVHSEAGGITMTDETRKELLVAYQKRKQEEIHHPFLNENVKIGLLFHVQAMLLARLLRGDLDGYPPFIWK